MFIADRYWFLTWRTYGSWLPGDDRGFVGTVRDGSGSRILRNTPGTPYEPANPSINKHAQALLSHDSIQLDERYAEILFAQLEETAAYRQWQLLAVGILSQHVHLVTGVRSNPDPEDILRDYKGYGSRALNRQSKSKVKWWLRSGSKRRLADTKAVLGAIKYVLEQEQPLLIWTAPISELGLTGGRIA